MTDRITTKNQSKILLKVNTVIVKKILLFCLLLLFLIPVNAKDDSKAKESYEKIRQADFDMRAYAPTGNGLTAFGGDKVLDPTTYGVPDIKNFIVQLKYCGWVDRKNVLRIYQHNAASGSPEALFQYALMALRITDCGSECPDAIKALEQAAEKGFAPAIYVLALCHEKAIGCFVDYEKAVKWYSLLQDDSKFQVQAQLGLASCYIVTKKYAEAEKILKPLVESGNPDALFLEYKRQIKDRPIAQEVSESQLKLLERSSQNGNLEAACELGLYYFGCHFSSDPVKKKLSAKMSDILRVAVKSNHPDALWLMSHFHRGIGDEKPQEDLAWEYTKQAAEYGSVYQRFEFATFDLGDENYIRAFQWLRPCILKKDRGSLYLAGSMLYYGLGQKRNIAKAYQYIAEAKTLGWDSKLCDEILSQINIFTISQAGGWKENSEKHESSSADNFEYLLDDQIPLNSSFARFIKAIGSISDSTNSFEKIEYDLSRIKPEECTIGNMVITADEMDFLLTLFKLEYCSILRKGRKTLMYSEQLEYILGHKKIDIDKLSKLLLGINLHAMKEIGLARADILKGTPEQSILRIKTLQEKLSPDSPEYQMSLYTLACLYIKTDLPDYSGCCIPRLEQVLAYFVSKGLNAYAAIVANRLALCCLGNLDQWWTWLSYSDDLAAKTNSSLVRSEVLLHRLMVHAAAIKPTNSNSENEKNKKDFESLKNDFLHVCHSDYYLRAGYFWCAKFETAFNYPPEVILGDLEKALLYWSLAFEGSAVGESESNFVSEIVLLKDRVLKLLAEQGQLEQVNFWTLQFERYRVRDRKGSDKMSLLAKMVCRLENANQILHIEQMKPAAQRDQKLILMAKEVKKELETYFDSLRHRLSKDDKRKLENILADSFIINPNSLHQLSAVLPPGVACVQIIPTVDSLIIYITAQNNPPFIKIVSLAEAGIDGKKLAALVSTTRAMLQDNRSSAQVTNRLKKLYDLLWRDLEMPLQILHTKKVIVNSSGLLRYIPFAALYDGTNYLVEKYQVTNVTGLDLIRLSMGAPTRDYQSINAVVFADPDGSLPAARNEGELIAKMFRNTSYYPGEKASLSEFESLLGNVNFIHLATHAVLDPNSPEDSYILFSKGDQWHYTDIGGFEIKNVDSFVLSACSTAVGANSDGGEIESMAYNLLCKSPAGSVLASFWRVDDAATAKFMSIYYKHIVDSIKKDNVLDRGGALREAQLSLLKNPDTSHPYYWAAFTLFGDFR